MKTEYALFLQAILFGAWHAHTDIVGYHGDVLNAVADMIASQAMFALGMGYLRIRTGNIAIWYNRLRTHSALAYLSPERYESQLPIAV